MQPMNDDGLGVEAQTILRETLQALETERVRRLIGDTSQCVDTGRIRRLAAVASAATVHEQRHAIACARCHARIEAFQGAKETTPQHVCEKRLQEARNASVQLIWVMFAEKKARHLFDAFLGEDTWPISDAVADELRNARGSGASEPEIAHLIATLLHPVAAISRDVLSPCSLDFDAAWPMFELLREAAKEAARGGGVIRDQFVNSYAQIAAGAPTHLRAVLVDGIDHLAGSELADALSTEIAMTDVSDETQALLESKPNRAVSAQLEQAIRSDVTPTEIADFIAATLHSLFEGLLSVPNEPFELLSRLRTIRCYLADLVSITRELSAEHRDSMLRAATEPLIDYATDERASEFLATEAARALAGESLAYAKVLSAMLATGNPGLLHAVVVGLRRAFEAMPAVGDDAAPRYERQGTIWHFTGASSHPLHETAAEVARMVEQHPELADSIEWFNHRFEPTAQNLLEKVR